jgi:dUTP pyrophosphatase
VVIGIAAEIAAAAGIAARVVTAVAADVAARAADRNGMTDSRSEKSGGNVSPELQVFVLKPGLASLPRYATEGAAGLDLAAALDAPLTIPRGQWLAVPTGLAIALPRGHEGQVRPRSGLASKHGVTVLNAPGTIDEDYRGELKVLLVNHGPSDFVVQPGDRIAQLVVAPIARASVAVVASVEALGRTTRGAGGFGSTGGGGYCG